MMSVNVGVSEPSNSPVGASLQLCGAGNTYGDFTWSGPSPESPGTLNSCQTIVPISNNVPVGFNDRALY